MKLRKGPPYRISVSEHARHTKSKVVEMIFLCLKMIRTVSRFPKVSIGIVIAGNIFHIITVAV